MTAETTLGLDTDALYRELFTPLFRYVFFRTRDYDLACDLTQTSFLKFLSHDHADLSPEHAQKRLFVIARNALIDHWRAAPTLRTEVRDDLDTFSTAVVDAETALITADDQRFVQELLAGLSEREAEIVSMRLADDVSYATIAAVLDLAEANVRQIYSRALSKLRARVEEESFAIKLYGTTR